MTLDERMEAIKASLAAALPARVVTRNFMPFTLAPEAELDAGRFSLVSQGVRDFRNFNGREAMDGVQPIVLVVHLRLPESSTGLQVEQAELGVVSEVSGWLRTLSPGPLCQLVLTTFTQSGQREAPYGWVIFELEFLGDS